MGAERVCEDAARGPADVFDSRSRVVELARQRRVIEGAQVHVSHRMRADLESGGNQCASSILIHQSPSRTAHGLMVLAPEAGIEEERRVHVLAAKQRHHDMERVTPTIVEGQHGDSTGRARSGNLCGGAELITDSA
jgi:hypothetical protein